MLTPTRFISAFALYAIAIAGLVAAVDFVIDPYLVFGNPRIARFNALKPAVPTKERMMKAYQSQRASARTIVLGSSRSDVGFDPAHAAWPAQMQPVYNLSMAGSDTSTALHYLQHVLAANPQASAPATIIVGLDFEYFLFDAAGANATPAARQKTPAVSEVDERLASDANGQPNKARAGRVLKDRALALLSLDALSDSVATVTASVSGTGANLEENGHLGESVFRQNVETDGVAALFDQKNQQAVSQLGQKKLVLSATPDAPIRDLQAVRQICDLARLHKIAVVFLIQPAHVSRLELMARLGYWGDYERWKRELVALSEQQRAAGGDVRLWDFGGDEGFVREQVPARKDRAGRLKWFWDPVHYTSALGDVMISRMFAPAGANDFGVELSPSNVETRLAETRMRRGAVAEAAGAMQPAAFRPVASDRQAMENKK